MLKEAANEIAPVLALIFNQSYNSGTLPLDWLSANVRAIFKKGKCSDPANYRPVSLTCISCKIMVYSQIMKHLDRNNILVHYQHGFRQGHSCESQLICTIDDLIRSMKAKVQIDLLILDFSKAFDTVPHEHLLQKLRYYGLPNQLRTWVRTWLTHRCQRVIVDGECSEFVHVRSGTGSSDVLVIC